MSETADNLRSSVTSFPDLGHEDVPIGRLEAIRLMREDGGLPGGDDVDWLLQIAGLYQPLVEILHAAPIARIGMGNDDIARALIARLGELRNAKIVLMAELEVLHARVRQVQRTVADEGDASTYHQARLERHRREWPQLWAALDLLLAPGKLLPATD